VSIYTNGRMIMAVIHNAYKVEEIDNLLFVNTSNANKIKIGMNKMRVND